MTEGQSTPAQGDIVTLSVAELEADPHAVLRRYRRQTPFVGHETGGYLVLRFADVEQLMDDPRAPTTEVEYPKLRGVTSGAIYNMFAYGMLTANDPAHRRRRAPFTRTFAARMIEELRPLLRESAEGLIDGWYEEGEVDLLGRFAAQIPAQAIATLLGLRKEDIPYFTQLVYRVSRFLSFTFAPEDLPDIEAATRALQDYVE
jgi:cytochrome P450